MKSIINILAGLIITLTFVIAACIIVAIWNRGPGVLEQVIPTLIITNIALVVTFVTLKLLEFKPKSE